VVDELGFIRLVLDRAGTVDEAMALAASHNVRFTSVPLHYFVADRSGDSAVIEFSGGKALFFHGKDGWQVSTNFLFADVPEDRRVAECWRYALATRELAASKGQAAPLIMLSELSQPSTLWSSVYDLGEGGGGGGPGGGGGGGGAGGLALGRRWEETLTWQLGR
jgi:choloylglycine hydrolase